MFTNGTILAVLIVGPLSGQLSEFGPRAPMSQPPATLAGLLLSGGNQQVEALAALLGAAPKAISNGPVRVVAFQAQLDSDSEMELVVATTFTGEFIAL